MKLKNNAVNNEVEELKGIEQIEEVQNEPAQAEVALEKNEEDIDDTEMYEQKVQKWKEEYGKIYLSVFDEVELIWHKLNRKTYSEIMDSISEAQDKLSEDMVIEQRQLLVIQRCTIYPEKEVIDEILEEYPGILTSLSTEILKRSGFSKPLTVEV